MNRFDTYLPTRILQPFIRTFSVQETADESVYKVLPDTGLVIGFQFRGRLARLENDAAMPLAISGISGLADHSRTFRNSSYVGSVLVFFKAGGAANFFRQPLHEIFRDSVSLDNFMLRSELLCLEEQLAEADNDPQRITAVEQFLINRMSHAEPDKLVSAALLAYEAGFYDQAHFIKEFKIFTGDTPEGFFTGEE